MTAAGTPEGAISPTHELTRSLPDRTSERTEGDGEIRVVCYLHLKE